MRVVIVGASSVSVLTARLLIERKHDVVIIEEDRERIDELAEDLDCGFVHGDGSKPPILREAGPSETGALLCLTDNDQDNIIASLVGRSLGFKRVVTRIADPEFQHICAELGLEDTIVPDERVAVALADDLEGSANVDLSTVLRGDLRFFVFVAGDEDAGPVADLALPADTKALYLYRGDDAVLLGPEEQIKAGDEVVLVTRRRHFDELKERWRPKGA